MLQTPVKTSYWYLYMYITFLVMLPFLRSIAQRLDFHQFLYMVACTIVVKDLFPLIVTWLGIEKINFSVFLNSFYVIYPLTGYYLDQNWEELQKKYQGIYYIILAFGALGIITAAGFTIHDYKVNSEWSEKYISLFYIPVATAVFLTFKNVCAKIVRSNEDEKTCNCRETICGTRYCQSVRLS